MVAATRVSIAVEFGGLEIQRRSVPARGSEAGERSGLLTFFQKVRLGGIRHWQIRRRLVRLFQQTTSCSMKSTRPF
jgi:hypothetical protein